MLIVTSSQYFQIRFPSQIVWIFSQSPSIPLKPPSPSQSFSLSRKVHQEWLIDDNREAFGRHIFIVLWCKQWSHWVENPSDLFTFFLYISKMWINRMFWGYHCEPFSSPSSSPWSSAGGKSSHFIPLHPSYLRETKFRLKDSNPNFMDCGRTLHCTILWAFFWVFFWHKTCYSLSYLAFKLHLIVIYATPLDTSLFNHPLRSPLHTILFSPGWQWKFSEDFQRFLWGFE